MHRGYPFVYVSHQKDKPNSFRFINIGFSDLKQFFDAVFVEFDSILKRHIKSIGPIVVATTFYSMFTVNRDKKEPFIHCTSAHPIYSFDQDNLNEIYSDFIVNPILSARDEPDSILYQNTNVSYDIDRFVVHIESMDSFEKYTELRLLH